MVGCEGGSEQSIESALQAVGEEPHVIITCTQVQEGSAGTPQAVAAELQQLQEAHDAVAALNKRQLTVYAVQPDASALVQQRRRLQSSNADVRVCGQLCQVSAPHMGFLSCGLCDSISLMQGGAAVGGSCIVCGGHVLYATHEVGRRGS